MADHPSSDFVEYDVDPARDSSLGGDDLEPVLESDDPSSMSHPYRSPRSKHAPVSLSSHVSKSDNDVWDDDSRSRISPLTLSSSSDDESSVTQSSTAEHNLATSSLSKRRRSAQMLEPLHIPASTWRTISISNDQQLNHCDIKTTKEGLNILAHFLLDELTALGFDGDYIEDSLRALSVINKPDLPDSLAVRIAQWSNQFRETPQRFLLQHKALHINVEDLTKAQFGEILNALFVDELVTVERVLVLLFFCLDLCTTLLKSENRSDFMNILDWMANFIKDRLSVFVFRHGDWSSIFIDRRQRYLNTGFALVTLGVIVAFCYAVWSRKKHF